MKFKNYIETESGIKDTSASPGTAGQLLSSTVAGTSWIDQAEIVAAGATRVLIACKNTSGGTITKGTPVYQTGNVGATDVIEVAEADALISTGYLPAIGLLETDLINNAFGHVVITGELLNITTSPIDGVVPVTGDTIYLKSGGGLTLTKPTGEGNAIQNLGLVGKVSGGNAGSLTVASIMRQNDVPNLPEGRIWIGDGNTIVSDTVYVDEPNGRVGIGTTSPLGAIQIGDGAAASPSTNQILVLSNTATTGGNSNLYLATGASGTSTIGMGSTQFSPTNTAGKIIYSDTVDTFSFNTNFSTKMVINGSGNVGIGTTNPGQKLHVDGNIRVGDSADVVYSNRFYGLSNAHVYLLANSGYDLKFYAGATEKMTVKSSGNVGIGATNPNSKLQVDGEIDANGGDGYRINGKPWAAESSNNLRLGDWDGEGFSTSIYGSNSSEVMRVTGNNVGIGTTSPQEKLHVMEEVPGTTLIEVENTRSNSNAGIKLSSGLTNYNVAYTNANGDFQIYNSSTNRTEFHIGANGKVGIDTTSPSEKLQVSGNVKANNYINQRVAWNSGFNHGSNNAASYYFIPVGYIAESTGDTYYNNWIAPYAGRVRKIVIRNTGTSTVPTATTVNFRVSVNGSVVHTGSTITVTGSGLNIFASETLSDSTAVFSATDRVQVAYRTNGLWRNAAAGISLEYTE